MWMRSLSACWGSPRRGVFDPTVKLSRSRCEWPSGMPARTKTFFFFDDQSVVTLFNIPSRFQIAPEVAFEPAPATVNEDPRTHRGRSKCLSTPKRNREAAERPLTSVPSPRLPDFLSIQPELMQKGKNAPTSSSCFAVVPGESVHPSRIFRTSSTERARNSFSPQLAMRESVRRLYFRRDSEERLRASRSLNQRSRASGTLRVLTCPWISQSLTSLFAASQLVRSRDFRTASPCRTPGAQIGQKHFACPALLLHFAR